MPDEPLLRAKAREAIRSGKLPLREPERILGGLGTGGTCPVCGLALSPTQMEIEVEFDSAPLAGFHAHPRCFAAWEFERTKHLPPPPLTI